MGPFQLARYDAGQRLVFARNPNYWRKADDGTALPYLDEVVMEIVPDQSVELLRLPGGQADMIQYALRPEDIATLRPLVDQKRVSLIELGVTTDPDVFFLNLRDRHWAKDPGGRGSPGASSARRSRMRSTARPLPKAYLPGRRGAGVGAGDPRQQGVVLAQRAALSLFRRSGARLLAGSG